jgi:uncharacterized protein
LLQREFDQVPWTMKQTLVGVFFTLLPWLIFFLIVTLGLPFTSTTPTPKAFSLQQDMANAVVGLVVSIISEGIFLLAPLHFAYRTMRYPLHPWTARWRALPDILGFRRFPILRSLALVVLSFVVVITVNYLYSLIITTFHLQIKTNDQMILDRGRVLPITTYTTLGMAVFIAPICEEIFFRSFTLMGLRRGMSVTPAIILSALIFALAHADPASFPVLFIIGMALAIVRLRTHSIWPSIILHTLNNATSALLIILILQGILS